MRPAASKAYGSCPGKRLRASPLPGLETRLGRGRLENHLPEHRRLWRIDMRQRRSGLRLRRGVRVLLTEGSSLSARQTLYALSYAGAHIDVCDPAPHSCLARYSRLVGNCYRCPSFTADPLGYLEFLKEHTRAQAYDVLFPVHDQVYLLARCRHLFKGTVGLAVPQFAALERLQS